MRLKQWTFKKCSNTKHIATQNVINPQYYVIPYWFDINAKCNYITNMDSVLANGEFGMNQSNLRWNQIQINKDNVKAFGDNRGKSFWTWIECV